MPIQPSLHLSAKSGYHEKLGTLLDNAMNLWQHGCALQLYLRKRQGQRWRMHLHRSYLIQLQIWVNLSRSDAVISEVTFARSANLHKAQDSSVRRFQQVMLCWNQTSLLTLSLAWANQQTKNLFVCWVIRKSNTTKNEFDDVWCISVWVSCEKCLVVSPMVSMTSVFSISA